MSEEPSPFELDEFTAAEALEGERAASSSGMDQRLARAVTAYVADTDDFASTRGALPLASLRRAAMASRILRRCPTIETPRAFRSCEVRFGRTISSISFSRNAAPYEAERLCCVT
jgi:hypothetical protein